MNNILEEFNPKSVIEEVVKQTPLSKFIKTTTGVRFEDIEFIFPTNTDFNNFKILVKRDGITVDYVLESSTLKKRLLVIFNSI